MHRQWLYSLRFEHVCDQTVLADYLLAVEHIEQRLTSFVSQLEQLAKDERYAQAVATLRCFRGFATVTVVTIVAELHTFHRFSSPRKLMAFVGLVRSDCLPARVLGNVHVRRERET